MNRKFKYYFFSIALITGFMSGCQEDLKVGTLSVDMKYFDKRQAATVGFPGEFGTFYFSKSSLPIEFVLEKVVEEAGGSTEELSKPVKISVYDQALSSYDSDLAESMKMDTIEVPAVEIDKFTGKLILHKNNKVLPGTYHFDVRLNNVSGTKLLEDALILKMDAFTMKSFATELGGKPEINYLGASPEQIVFKVYKYNATTKLFDQLSTVDHFFIERESFTGNDNSYIKSDTHDGGEVWQVKFPISFYGSFFDLANGIRTNKGAANIDFGQSGNYEVKVFIK